MKYFAAGLVVLGGFVAVGCAPVVKFVVTDCATKQPVGQAKLQLVVDSVPRSSTQTGADGTAKLRLPRGDSTEVSIFAKGYREDHAIYGESHNGRVEVCLSSEMP